MVSRSGRGRPQVPAASRSQIETHSDAGGPVCEWLTKDATAFGFRTNLWSSTRIVKLIRERFGIEYNPNYFCRWLHAHGFSPQKPAKRASQRDEARIAAWPQTEWPALLKKGLPKTPISC